MHVWMSVLEMLVLCMRGLFTGFHVQVVAFRVDEPVDDVLFASWSTSARARKQVRGGRIHGECKEVGRFGEVGDEALVEEEIRQDKDIHQEHEDQDEHPPFGHVVNTARSVLLGFEGAIKVLPSVVVEKRDVGGVVLSTC